MLENCARCSVNFQIDKKMLRDFPITKKIEISRVNIPGQQEGTCEK